MTETSARWRLQWPRVRLRFGLAALLAFLLQAIAVFAPLGDGDLAPRLLFISSYILLFVFVAANIRRPGVAILGIGIALNFLPIIANGGLMPITPETVERTGEIPDGVEPGDWIPGSKDILLEREDVRLYFLSDRLVSGASPVRAFSIGDVVILAGLIVLLGDLLLPRPVRTSADGGSGPPTSPIDN